MKRVLSLLLTLTMIFVLAAPCFAVESKVEPRSSYSKYVSDDKTNRFKVTGTATISGYVAIVLTSFSVANYAHGDHSSINGVTETVSTSGSVYFSDNTSPNHYALSNSTSYTGAANGSTSDSENFTAPPSSVNSTHTFNTSTGISGFSFSYGTTA